MTTCVTLSFQIHSGVVDDELESAEQGARLQQQLAERGILISSGKRIRLVTHLDIAASDVERFVREVKLRM